MTGATTGIVKKGRVRPSPPRRLEAAAGPHRPAGGPVAGAPQVRIVERHADRAALEVRCACGRITHVECQWQVPPPAAASGTGTPDPREPGSHSPKEEV